MTPLKINRLLPIYTSIVPLKSAVDIQCQIWNWNWNSKANLTYAPETMSSTDRRMDGRTDKVNPVYFVGRGYNDKVNPVYPPPTSLGGGIIRYFTWKMMQFLISIPLSHLHISLVLPSLVTTAKYEHDVCRWSCSVSSVYLWVKAIHKSMGRWKILNSVAYVLQIDLVCTYPLRH